MKIKTILTFAGGIATGVAGGIALCATKFGQEKVLVPVMGAKQMVENKLKSKKDDDEPVPAESSNEHVEKD